MAFGKRKLKPETPSLSSSSSSDSWSNLSSWATQPEDFMPVIVRQSVINASHENNYALVQGVIDYVNAVQSLGLYHRLEMPIKAIQAFHCDYYLAQVLNGGHSQFIHNALIGGEFDATIQDVGQGLPAMGGHDFFDIFDRMMDWYDKNPEEASQQNGFEVRAGFLDELDTAFYALNDKMYDLSTAWIRGWPELKIVPDPDYETEIIKLARANPKREERLVAQRILSLSRNFSEPLRVALSLAAAGCNPPERLLSINNGGHKNLPDGRNEMLWNVQTTHGKRYGYTGEEFCALYDRIVHDNSHMPDITDREGMLAAIDDGRLDAYKPSEVGEALSGIATADIMKVRARASQVHAGAAIDLLLLRVNLDPNEASVGVQSIKTEDGDPLLLEMSVHVKERNFKVGIFDNGAVLLPWVGAEALATASIEEILLHQEKTKAMDFS